MKDDIEKYGFLETFKIEQSFENDIKKILHQHGFSKVEKMPWWFPYDFEANFNNAKAFIEAKTKSAKTKYRYFRIEKTKLKALGTLKDKGRAFIIFITDGDYWLTSLEGFLVKYKDRRGKAIRCYLWHDEVRRIRKRKENFNRDGRRTRIKKLPLLLSKLPIRKASAFLHPPDELGYTCPRGHKNIQWGLFKYCIVCYSCRRMYLSFHCPINGMEPLAEKAKEIKREKSPEFLKEFGLDCGIEEVKLIDNIYSIANDENNFDWHLIPEGGF